MKKILFISLILLAGIAAHAQTQTWNIGSPVAADVTATLRNDTLYVRGTGDMTNITTPSPWQGSGITAAVIEQGVTNISSWFFLECYTLASVIIPEGVASIGNAVFSNCNALTSIVIPETVASIGSGAFQMCYSLTSITNINPVPQNISANVFTGINLSAATLTVPCGSLSAYQNAPVWQDFGTIVEDCPQAGVSNVKANFSCPGQVTVNYDLNTTDPVDVILYYSADGGKTWLTAQSISGDLIAQDTGSGKTIVWDNRADNVKWGKFRLKVEVPQAPKQECVEINGVCWATCNVNAPGTFVPKPEDYGMLYQWNSTVGWSSTDPLVSTDGSVWNGSWNGNGASIWETSNEICPAGFHIPAEADIDKLLDTNKVNNAWIIQNGVQGRIFIDRDTGKSIFLPAVGYRDYNTGILLLNSFNDYWCKEGYSINFTDIDIHKGAYHSAYGHSVRCIKD